MIVLAQHINARCNYDGSSAVFFRVVRRRLGVADASAAGGSLLAESVVTGAEGLVAGAIGPLRRRCQANSSGLARPCKASSIVKSAIVRTTQSK